MKRQQRIVSRSAGGLESACELIKAGGLKSARRWVVVAVALLSIGCHSTTAKWEGPNSAVSTSVKPWRTPSGTGRTIRTPHYLIHTTVEKSDFNGRIAQLMEGSLKQYSKLVPNIELSARPMECYIFAKRDQWEAFTRQATGPEAPIYLRVNRGGYTIDDWYACYFIGDAGTYDVAAHEGWHQFVGRHFREPIPPFLEEGIGTMFQNVHWDNDLPRWNWSLHPARVHRLRNVMERKMLIPLDELIRMHAGDVVKTGSEKIESFYSETWAFARFCCEGENGKYYDGLKKMLSDAAAGRLHGIPEVRAGEWNPDLVKPLLEHYLRADLPTLDREFQAYMKSLAFEKYEQQFSEDAE
jgi:hypothetical protein